MSQIEVRKQACTDYEAIRLVYAAAFLSPRFRAPMSAGCIPPEVDLFDALWKAGDTIPEFSFTAFSGGVVVGHATVSPAKVADYSVVALGPIGVVPAHQGTGVGSALMNALIAASDTAAVPLVALLGAPQYYGRFGFRPATDFGVISPQANWGLGFQVRTLTAYSESVRGQFQYAPAFSSADPEHAQFEATEIESV